MGLKGNGAHVVRGTASFGPGGTRRKLRYLVHSPRNRANTSDGANATVPYQKTHSTLPAANLSPL